MIVLSLAIWWALILAEFVPVLSCLYIKASNRYSRVSNPLFVLALLSSPGLSLVSLTPQVTGRDSRLQPARVRKKIRNIWGLESSAMIAWEEGIELYININPCLLPCLECLMLRMRKTPLDPRIRSQHTWTGQETACEPEWNYVSQRKSVCCLYTCTGIVEKWANPRK